MPDYVVAPFVVIADSREGHPFTFTGFKSDARHGYKSLIVPVVTRGLKTGDYSLEGYEDRIAVERKSAQDAYSTFSQERERFIRELERLNEMEFAAVVIEAGWPSLLKSPPPQSKFSPKSFFRSVVAWQVRYPRVQWWAAETRSWAERVTLRWLERWWKDEQERIKQAERQSA
jgi:ERCC4-type nuclease